MNSDPDKSNYVYNPPKSGAEIVPFGKYKDQPVQLLLADSGYMEWLTGQPGLMAMLEKRYPVIFNIITVGAPRTDDTPEHNKMQALFLARDFQYAFIEAVLDGKSVHAIALEAAQAARAHSQEALGAAVKHLERSAAEDKQRLEWRKDELKKAEEAAGKTLGQ
jgi:hypothetical protein